MLRSGVHAVARYGCRRLQTRWIKGRPVAEIDGEFVASHCAQHSSPTSVRPGMMWRRSTSGVEAIRSDRGSPSLEAAPRRRESLRGRICAVVAAALALASTACTERWPARAAPPPIVAGLVQPGLTARTRGLLLLGELGCVSCHRQEPAAPAADARTGPDLATLGERVRADWIARYLADPLVVAPGTAMPDLLRDRDDPARMQAAEALSHYLRSFAGPTAVAEVVESAAAVRGRPLFHEIGCVACHAPRDEAGNEVATPGSVPLARLAEKYPLQGLRAFLLAPHLAHPAARMPDLHLSPAEAHDLANYLLATPSPSLTVAPALSSTPPPVAADADLLAAGRAAFAERGCAHCHALTDPARAPTPRPKALREVDPAGGCLSGDVGPWPFYALTPEQRADLNAALAAGATPEDDEQRIVRLMASRNCTACHARGAFGGVAPERAAYFVSNDPSVGAESRLPPPLTGVGAKLQHEWLAEAIAHGQSARPYLRTRMPGFGVRLGKELSQWLARADTLPPLEVEALPEDEKQARAVTDLGRDLVGDRGMSCIACHAFAGEKVGTMGAIDLVESTAQRLRPQWFAHFLRAPLRMKPGTLMPLFFPDGASVRPELGGGDVARQIDAMWHYLAQGRNVGKPSGVHPAPIELVVGDEAVILRRSAQNTGKRGISVGYPLGVNVTFDAERLALNQIWWGKFIDAAGVWTGQGSGEARILSRDLATLPNGPAFVALHNAQAPWPEASRRELGQRFLGYDLDDRQRPTFRYVCEEVTVSDALLERQVDGARTDSKPMLRRTLRFSSVLDKTLHFRAALDGHIDGDDADGGHGVLVGGSLHLRLSLASFVIRPVGEKRELLVAIPIEKGRAELVIDYTWQEAAK
ncbi:MAG: c-type cytochrome [Planctomycetes bacterium]|nr:c-type cytochrome [Planctomycetota bacterium]